MKTLRSSAFTLLELMVATGLFAIVGAGLFVFMTTAVRLIARNLATNHSHDAVRGSTQRMLADLHNSHCAFRLYQFDGATSVWSEIGTPVASTDTDPQTAELLSQRSNAVSFRKLAGGPFRITRSTIPTDNTFEFEFAVGTDFFQPVVGDKIFMPLISMQYEVTAIPAPPTSGNTKGTVAITQSVNDGYTAVPRVGFTLAADPVNNVTTGYFFRRAAYAVWNGELRLYYNGTVTVVRNNVTSPRPFALLFPAGTGKSTDGLKLRVSLEAYDTQYSARLFGNATTTLQTTIPPRNQPTFLSKND